MENLLQVGIITTTHGIKGEVKVYPTTDDPKRFTAGMELLLDTGKEQLPVHVAHVTFFKNMVILKFREFNSINDVEIFRTKSLYVTREQAVPCEENEYFIADLLGLTVCSDTGVTLGRISDVLQTGANDVYVVERQGAKDLLLPAIHDCIRSIDVEKGCMVVHVLEGLLDEE